MRTLPQSIINSIVLIIMIPLLYWIHLQAHHQMTYPYQILSISGQLFTNSSLSGEYPKQLVNKKYSATRGTESLVKIAQLGYKYEHQPSLFYSDVEFQPGQILSLLLLKDQNSRQLAQIQLDYFSEKYGLALKMQKQLCVIVSSHNNEQTFKDNLKSIFQQNYKNYKAIYIDDASTDNTFILAKNFIAESDVADKFVPEKNVQFKGNLWNHYHYVQKHCEPSDVVVSIDGSDSLIGPNVFTLVNEIYRDGKVWVSTSESFAHKDNSILFSSLPDARLKKKQIRTYSFRNLKTFLAGLFMRIKSQSFLNPETGQFFTTSTDKAMLYPMIEMSRRERYLYCQEILYFQNKTEKADDQKTDKIIQEMTPYSEVVSPY